MARRAIADGSGSFEVTLLESWGSHGVVLFSVGGGGDPERHAPLLASLSNHGFTVVAPHFERLTSPRITGEQLMLRARRLSLALDLIATPNAAVVGIGHSIGATALLSLAGATVWMGPGNRLSIERDSRLKKLALLAPAAGFFQAPGALDDVQVPIAAWAGGQDTITPPAQAELLARGLAGRIPVELRVEAGAGHFSFMHTPPPHAVEPLSDRDEFLARLTAEVLAFVAESDPASRRPR